VKKTSNILFLIFLVFFSQTDDFADGANIQIGGNNAGYIKVISEGVGIVTTLLKTGQIEENG
jgi:hypothetical protein